MRLVNQEDAKMLAERYNIKYIETSAKDSTNVNSLFEDTAQQYLMQNKQQERGKGVTLNTTLLKKGNNSKCCG